MLVAGGYTSVGSAPIITRLLLATHKDFFTSFLDTNMAYQLTEDDLDTQKEWGSAPVRAARNPNPAVLQALMAYYQEGLSRWEQLSQRERKFLQYYEPNEGVCGAIWGTYESPLTAAIRAKLTCNVNFLLALGADCNGISAHDLSDYSVRFLRGRDAGIDVSSFVSCPPRAELLATAKAKGIESQLAPLTSVELDERRDGFPRFWTESNVPGQRLRMNTALTALEVAAQCGYEELFDIVHTAGAEDSSWRSTSETQEESPLEVPSEAPLSKLSVSSPVHQAIASGHRPMLNKLFKTYNYCPNYRPLVAPTVALPPLSFAIARCDLAKPGVRECISDLFAHPRLAPHLRTPVFEIHPLHFATARHDPEFLVWISASIPGGHATAGRTALGHTLLHVAALPLTGDHTAKTRPAVERSIHCSRTLDYKWLQHSQPSPRHLKYPMGRFPRTTAVSNPLKQKPMTEAEQAAQLATIKLLLEWGEFDVRTQDIDGNTALHYLAATLNVDSETVKVLREMDGGEDVWQSSRNWCGLTPKQLKEE